MKYLLVDGENFKGKIKDVCNNSLHVPHPQWHQFNFSKLFTSSLAGLTIDKTTFYFAKIKQYKESFKKSNELIEEQRLLKTALEAHVYEVVLAGSVRGHQNTEGKMIFKEKGVDVRIAVDMVSMACDKQVTDIVLCSSDSDLRPAISEAKRRGMQITYLGFGISPNKGLTHTTDETILIRDIEIKDSMPVTLLP